MQSWVWRQLRVDLPEDWELLQFTRNPESGRCAWADRHQFRFELNWRNVQGPPDFERMLNDYRAKLEENGLQQTRSIEATGWRGFAGQLPDGRATSRYGRYLEQYRCLVETVFLWPKARQAQQEERILETLHHETPTGTGQGRWRAFGIEAWTGAAYRFEKCVADPAHARFSFSAENRRLWDTFSRRGMLPHWLREPMEVWHRRQVPRGYRIQRQNHEDVAGHSVDRLLAIKRHPVLPDLIFGRRVVQSACWVCPHDGRLYHLSREAPRRRRDTRPDRRPPAALRCCAAMEVAL